MWKSYCWHIAIYIYNYILTKILVSHTGTAPRENNEHFCRKKSCRVGASTISLAIIIFLIVAAALVGVVVKMKSLKGQDSTETQFNDVMQGDTILLYKGYSRSVTISKVFPDTSSRPDIGIFVTNCNNLVTHIETNHTPNRDYNFTLSDPTRVMSNTFYFELGSVMNFSLATINAGNGSSLALLMFDDDTKANKYIHFPSPSTRSQAVAEWEINNLTAISFTPTYRSYYVPIFAPVVNGELGIRLSYNVTRVFYSHSDYRKYANCSLNTGSCTLNFYSKNETCILVYNPSFQAATLQINIIENKKPGKVALALKISMYICITLLVLIVSYVLCVLLLCIKWYRAV